MKRGKFVQRSLLFKRRASFGFLFLVVSVLFCLDEYTLEFMQLSRNSLCALVREKIFMAVNFCDNPCFRQI